MNTTEKAVHSTGQVLLAVGFIATIFIGLAKMTWDDWRDERRRLKSQQNLAYKDRVIADSQKVLAQAAEKVDHRPPAPELPIKKQNRGELG